VKHSSGTLEDLAITRLHSTAVFVKDQEAALDFYINTLGWTKAIDQPMGPEYRYVTVVPPAGGAQLALEVPAGFHGEGSVPGRFNGISFVTEDVDATYAELSAKGVRFKSPVEDMPWGARATWFYDIDGNEFFLTADQEP